MATHLTSEMAAAIERLHRLSASDQDRLAPHMNEYLTRLEELCEAIRDGEESGPPEPLDMAAVKRSARGAGSARSLVPRITLRPLAREDLVDAWRYVAGESGPDRADRYLDRIERKLQRLAEQPYMGRARPGLAPDLRSFTAASHVVFFGRTTAASSSCAYCTGDATWSG